MKVLREFPYNRKAAVEYANQWAYRRNPLFYDFEELGGDCTNYASQCIFAGTGVMNFTPTYGWYYVNLNNRAPSWTSVVYLYDFLITNKGVGPYGIEVSIEDVEPGDICQLFMDKERFQHTPVITSLTLPKTPNSVLVAAHSMDCNCRPLDTYKYKKVRFIHILGFRTMEELANPNRPPQATTVVTPPPPIMPFATRTMTLTSDTDTY